MTGIGSSCSIAGDLDRFDNLFARQSEIARDARGVSHHCRKQRLLPARRLFAFPNKAFHQSCLKGESAAEYVGYLTTSQEAVAHGP